MPRFTVSSFYIYSHKLAAKYLYIGYLAVSLCKGSQTIIPVNQKEEKPMFVQKTIVMSILGVVLMLCLTACGLNKEELSSLDSATGQKLQTAVQLFESDDLKAAVTYCENKDNITIGDRNFTIFCTVVANLYKPGEDVIKVSGNKTILPVSLYIRVDHRSIGYLDEGYLYRKTTISAFTWGEKDVNPLVTKRKDFE
jgi:hypothetical protein